jgi:hypothetical protein
MKNPFNRRPMTPAREARINSVFLPAATEMAAKALPTERMDASSTLFLARQLEELDAETYWVEYAEFQGVLILPIKSNINPGADNYKYQIRDRVGEFNPSANLTDDSAEQDIAGDNATQNLYSWRGHYNYSVQDMRRAAMAGQPLENDKAMGCRENAETTLTPAFGKCRSVVLSSSGTASGLWVLGAEIPHPGHTRLRATVRPQYGAA